MTRLGKARKPKRKKAKAAVVWFVEWRASKRYDWVLLDRESMSHKTALLNVRRLRRECPSNQYRPAKYIRAERGGKR